MMSPEERTRPRTVEEMAADFAVDFFDDEALPGRVELSRRVAALLREALAAERPSSEALAALRERFESAWTAFFQGNATADQFKAWIYRELLAAPAAPRERETGDPPKDGTPILAWCPIVAGFGDDETTPDGEWRVVWWEARGQWTSDRDLGNEVFTVWYRLPPAPSTSGGK